MAFVATNGFDVEHASQMLVYENLMPEIQHINGKGCIDKYTKTNDVESVTLIDVMRILPYAPRFRKLGATNNGTWHNQKNEGGFNNAPQATKYTIPVDLYYDEGVSIVDTQQYSTPVAFKQVVMAQIIQSAGLSINVATFAKQFAAFFRDSFADPDNPTADELATAVFAANKALGAAEEGSYAEAFIAANSQLSEGIPELGAFIVPMDERQAFVTPTFDRIMKKQYMQNASEAAARILANGYINPWTDQESKRIDYRTGLCGQYDGVDMFIYNKVTNSFVEVALGIPSNDSTKDATRTLFEKVQAMIIYGAGTCRGIVGPTVIANQNPFYGGVYILPKLKMGVEVLNGKTIKLVVDGGWTSADIKALAAGLVFTPIDGKVVTGNGIFGANVFNDGTSN